MTPRRELTLACAAVGVGSGLVLIAGGRTWVRAVVDLPRPFPPASYALTGHDLAPLAWALGLAGLAGLAGVIATRGYARLLIGVVIVLVGLAVPAASYLGVAAPGAVHEALATTAVLVRGGEVTAHPTPWWAVSFAGGLLVAAGGALVALRGRRWPGLSRRYDAPSAPRPTAEDDAAGMWDSLDRGRDPTVR